jgi:uncharacterized protein (UPF0332 family)
MNEESGVLLDQARKSLRAAEVLFDKGFPDEASSRVYYGMFYATQAVLKAVRIDVHKHSAVVSSFGHWLMNSGKIDKRLHRLLLDAKEMRERCDYFFEREEEEPGRSVTLEDARGFVDAMGAFLKAEGHV